MSRNREMFTLDCDVGAIMLHTKSSFRLWVWEGLLKDYIVWLFFCFWNTT